jgi:hypothetical protein
MNPNNNWGKTFIKKSCFFERFHIYINLDLILVDDKNLCSTPPSQNEFFVIMALPQNICFSQFK